MPCISAYTYQTFQANLLHRSILQMDAAGSPETSGVHVNETARNRILGGSINISAP
jgi:hypothetical protein